MARKSQGGLILGPTRVDMGKRVNETLQATVDFHLESNDGAEIFNGRGRHAGLEVQGELEKLR
jgi:tocopherol cyclase